VAPTGSVRQVFSFKWNSFANNNNAKKNLVIRTVLAKARNPISASHYNLGSLDPLCDCRRLNLFFFIVLLCRPFSAFSAYYECTRRVSTLRHGVGDDSFASDDGQGV